MKTVKLNLGSKETGKNFKNFLLEHYSNNTIITYPHCSVMNKRITDENFKGGYRGYKGKWVKYSYIPYLNLSNLIFYNCSFENMHFKGLNFLNVHFENCTFNDCMFENCRFDSTKFENTKLSNLKIEACNLLNIKMDNSYMCMVYLYGNGLINLNCNNCELQFNKIDSPTIGMINVEMGNCILYKKDLSKSKNKLIKFIDCTFK